MLITLRLKGLIGGGWRVVGLVHVNMHIFVGGSGNAKEKVSRF